MTMLRSALAALLLASAMGAPVLAAPEEPDVPEEQEVAERDCSFNAEAGGYVCDAFETGGSLSDLNDRNARKKHIWVPIINIFP